MESGAVNSLEDVRGAIVRIVAEGSFADPEFGQQYNAAGSGSGFFIDPEGLVVTNNHVVTGAAFLQVYVEGEDEPRNARVLGVSECSDLAVIDVEGEGFPFLEWFDGDLAVGTQIYAAGFPLGDEEYTLLDGIISKEKADGESDWASVDSVIEHSADTLPGNSGGPIVTEDGKVVAVNYAGDGLGQAFGIGRDEASKVIPTLVEGDDVASIGINGQALVDGGFSGIWVASVASGSPADLGGIMSGDLVTLVEGLIPATDGSMADYCDILRSNAPGDPLAVEVYRATEGVFLEGTLNTEKTLDLAFSFESTLQDDVAEVTGDAPSTDAGYPSYVTLADINNTMSVEVPEAWADVDTESLWAWGDANVGAALSAATDFPAWVEGWDTPGVFFGASATLSQTESVGSILDGQDYTFACDYDGRYEYSDALYQGEYDLYINCEGEDTLFVVVAAESPGSPVLMMLQIVVVSDADLEAMDTILDTFVVDEAALAELSGADAVETTVGQGSVDFFDLLNGDCFNPGAGGFGEVAYGVTVESVDCAVPHEAEVFAWTVIPGEEFPGDGAVADGADAFCGSEFSGYVGSEVVESSLNYWYFYPNQAGWVEYPFYMCAVRDPNGAPLVDSAYQSGW
jgi:serine protease Do